MNIKEKVTHAKNKGYFVDDNGNVFSKRKQLLLREHKSYYHFSISHLGQRITMTVHKFVAYLKYGNDMFEKDIIVRHFDGNSRNNAPNNILIGTSSQNRQDIPKVDRIQTSILISSKNRRFSDEEVKQIQNDRKCGLSYKLLCEKYSTSKSTLSYLFNDAYYSGKRQLK